MTSKTNCWIFLSAVTISQFLLSHCSDEITSTGSDDDLHIDTDGDPISSLCGPLCRLEDREMMVCAIESDCSEVMDDIQAYNECMAPCIQLSDECFSLCGYHYNFLVETCVFECDIDESDCLLDCYTDLFVSVKIQARA